MDTFLYLNFGDGIATIAINETENIVQLGAAFCSPKDKFERKIGRKVALDRMMQKKDFYVSFEKNDDLKLKRHVREIVKLIVSGEWVSKLDFETELETKIHELITETSNDFPSDIAPMTVHTNTVPAWAKRAVVEKNFY